MKVQIKYHWLELGTEIPLFTVYATNEKQALNKLRAYLSKIGKSDVELVRVLGNG